MLPDLLPQKAYNWLVGIQRELSTNVSIELNYTGSKGMNLGSIQRPNRFTGDRLDGIRGRDQCLHGHPRPQPAGPRT